MPVGGCCGCLGRFARCACYAFLAYYVFCLIIWGVLFGVLIWRLRTTPLSWGPGPVLDPGIESVGPSVSPWEIFGFSIGFALLGAAFVVVNGEVKKCTSRGNRGQRLPPFSHWWNVLSQAFFDHRRLLIDSWWSCYCACYSGWNSPSFSLEWRFHRMSDVFDRWCEHLSYTSLWHIICLSHFGFGCDCHWLFIDAWASCVRFHFDGCYRFHLFGKLVILIYLGFGKLEAVLYDLLWESESSYFIYFFGS